MTEAFDCESVRVSRAYTGVAYGLEQTHIVEIVDVRAGSMAVQSKQTHMNCAHRNKCGRTRAHTHTRD